MNEVFIDDLELCDFQVQCPVIYPDPSPLWAIEDILSIRMGRKVSVIHAQYNYERFGWEVGAMTIHAEPG